MTMIDPDARGDLKHRVKKAYKELDEDPLYKLLMEKRQRITKIGTKGYKKEFDGDLVPVLEDWVNPVIEEIMDVQDYIRESFAKKNNIPFAPSYKKRN